MLGLVSLAQHDVDERADRSGEVVEEALVSVDLFVVAPIPPRVRQVG